jgi:selenocysteine lyase/cysteine desulfurase
MSELLYLDTARIGRMSSQAKQAHHAFAELVAEEGGSYYFERFLRNGYTHLPTSLTICCRGLAGWNGIDALKQSMRKVADGRLVEPVLLANRSAQLMKLAARILFHPCENVLTTDLDWPGYRELLVAECRRANRTLTIVPIRAMILQNKLSEGELAERLRKEFELNKCDGLFLTAVSNDGLRLPIRQLVESLESRGRTLFTVVDGAQDFCHTCADFRSCDLYLTGAHKWLRAYHPLGIGFYGRTRSKKRIERLLAKMIHAADLDDPLLRLTSESLADQNSQLRETFNLAGLFTAQSAIGDVESRPGQNRDILDQRVTNRETASQLAQRTDWQPIAPDPSLRTGILMLRPENPAIARQHPDTLREAFRDRGISLSTYPEGLLRLSMPATPFTGNELMQLSDGLRSVNKLFG